MTNGGNGGGNDEVRMTNDEWRREKTGRRQFCRDSEEARFWRHNAYSLWRQGLVVVFEAPRLSRRDNKLAKTSQQPRAHTDRSAGRKDHRVRSPLGFGLFSSYMYMCLQS